MQNENEFVHPFMYDFCINIHIDNRQLTTSPYFI